eukprot:Gb_12388 [translate_table: standard]
MGNNCLEVLINNMTVDPDPNT